MATPEEELETLKQQVTDLNTQLAEAGKGGAGDSEELTRLRGINAELIANRDAGKETKRKADEDALKKNQEFETLSQNLQTERDALTKQLEGLTGKVEEYTQRDEAKLQTLIELIPENLRETVAGNSGTLAEKIDLAEKLATVKPAAPGARPGGDGGGGNTVTRQAFDAMDAGARSKFCTEGGKVTD